MKLSSPFFLLASVALGTWGCSSEVAEPGGERAPIAKHDVDGNVTQPGPSVKGEQAVGPSFEVGSVVPSEVFVCRKGAFCDDFESVDAPSRWTGSEENGGDVGRSNASASLGKGSLALTTKPGATNSAFLLLDKGQIGATWSGSLSFAMRVAELPKDSVGGPELAVKTIDDGVVSLAFVLKPEGVFLEQRATADCKKDRCQTKSTLVGTAAAGKWTKIDLGIESAPNGGAPYGRVEVKVNGGPLVAVDLGVPLGSGTTFLRAGITAGDIREAFLDLDDVTLLTR